MKTAIFAAFFLLTACGRVSDPLPPIVRIPQKIDKLSAAQSGYAVVLSWTNPAKYIDNTSATDLGVVHVFRNNVEIGTVAAGAAGQPQSFSVDVRNSVGSPATFTIQLVVRKASKPSPISNEITIQPVDVPGSPRILPYVVDQGKIVLTWDAPERNAALVDGYVVQRSDKPAAPLVRTPRFEDLEYEPGKTYTYIITAVRGTNPQIVGDGSLTQEVVAIDKTPPAAPTGVQIMLIGDSVFLVWAQNMEADFKTYRLFRSDRPTQPILTVANGYSDSDYVPGAGISYQVLAEDASGNLSLKSAPIPQP